MEPVYRTVVGLCLATFKLKRWDVQVSGTEHLPASGGAVIATNHISYVDFIFVGAGVLEGPESRLVRFAAKKEAFDHPVSGPLMRAMKHIPVDRHGDASAAVDTAVNYLERGELVGMFPEATISRSFVPMPGKTGTVRMAQRAGVPIIPGAVWGSQRLFPKGRPRDLRSDVTITVSFDAPLVPSPDDDPSAATDELMERIGRLVDTAQRSYPDTPETGEDWWLPAHLGGSAPTPEEAERMAREERERRAARRDGSAD
ncbi:MAG: lysophospholipid acyltransferase family protein [Nitriliruptorales bacterium]|nr:lysophospholipid acyltransferase family protein [Nitriliruptorales bacterium]